MRMGPMEIGLILVIVLIVFGAGKLPEVGGAIGKAMRSFRQESRGGFDGTEKPATKMEIKNTAESTNKSNVN